MGALLDVLYPWNLVHEHTKKYIERKSVQTYSSGHYITIYDLEAGLPFLTTHLGVATPFHKQMYEDTTFRAKITKLSV